MIGLLVKITVNKENKISIASKYLNNLKRKQFWQLQMSDKKMQIQKEGAIV